jgi:hypothetical protein
MKREHKGKRGSTRYRIRNLTGRCGASGADTDYLQEALEDIFLYLDMMEKKCRSEFWPFDVSVGGRGSGEPCTFSPHREHISCSR